MALRQVQNELTQKGYGLKYSMHIDLIQLQKKCGS